MAARNILRTVFSLGACMALLGGCTWLTSWDGSPDQTLAPPPPQATVMQTADATWMKPTDKGAAVARQVPEIPQGNRDGMERLARLEIQVGQMQNDMKTMMPVLNRLVAVQTDTQAMLAKLEGGSTATAVTPSAMSAPLAGSTATATTPEAVAMAATAPPAAMTPVLTPPLAAAPAVAPASGAMMAPAVMIQGMRIGEHPGKTRIVLDTTDTLVFTQGVDNATQTLTVDVQGADWRGVPQNATPKSPLLASWQAAPNGQGGTRFTMQLRKPARVLAAQTLKPSRGVPARIMIDLAPL